MLSLHKHHITNVYVTIDELLPAVPQTAGRPAVLSTSEVITILVWMSGVEKCCTLKDAYHCIQRHYTAEFPRLPHYTTFVEHCHRAIPQLLWLVQQSLDTQASLRFIDSTFLEVCKLVRADSHKVAKNVASFGKNHQGWHYGFKLHISINHHNQLSSVVFTTASFHDAQALPKLLNKYTQLAVGDGGYTASVMHKRIWEDYGCIILSPPHPKQKRKLLTMWQHTLLTLRPKVECVFDYLKQHLGIVSSFPRSVNGYLLHYLRILLGYQLLSV